MPIFYASVGAVPRESLGEVPLSAWDLFFKCLSVRKQSFVSGWYVQGFTSVSLASTIFLRNWWIICVFYHFKLNSGQVAPYWFEDRDAGITKLFQSFNLIKISMQANTYLEGRERIGGIVRCIAWASWAYI